MASSLDYIKYVADQLGVAGETRYKKMFGEYMVYVDNVPAVLVCDNTVYIKIIEEIQEYMISSPRGFPYPSAKEHYILDIDDKDLIEKVMPLLKEHYLAKK